MGKGQRLQSPVGTITFKHTNESFEDLTSYVTSADRVGTALSPKHNSAPLGSFYFFDPLLTLNPDHVSSVNIHFLLVIHFSYG